MGKTTCFSKFLEDGMFSKFLARRYAFEIALYFFQLSTAGFNFLVWSDLLCRTESGLNQLPYFRIGAHHSYTFSPKFRFAVTRSTKSTCSMLCCIDVVIVLSSFRIDDACNMIHAGCGASYIPTSAMSSQESFCG